MLITGKNFELLANINISKNIINVKDKNNILYCDTHDVSKALVFLNKNKHIKFTVISHNSDDSFITEPTDNVKIWFAQNCNIKHDRVKAIPIGLENDHWFIEQQKQHKILSAYIYKKKKTNNFYANFNVDTNPIRNIWAEKIKQLGINMIHGKNPYNFDKYLQGLEISKFTFSPPGNGIDCHRTWEALYCYSVPIVQKSILTEQLADIGLYLVEDINLLNLNDIIEVKINHKKLTMLYWIEEINKYND